MCDKTSDMRDPDTLPGTVWTGESRTEPDGSTVATLLLPGAPKPKPSRYGRACVMRLAWAKRRHGGGFGPVRRGAPARGGGLGLVSRVFYGPDAERLAEHDLHLYAQRHREGRP